MARNDHQTLERATMENPLLRAELSKPGGIAVRLTDARTRANLSGKDLAHRTGMRTSKVSKLAGGQQLPTAADVHAWMAACNADSQSIRDLQSEVERVRQAAPSLNRAYRRDGQSLERHQGGVTAPASLAGAYERGYAAAVRDMQRLLASLTSTNPSPLSVSVKGQGSELDATPPIEQMEES